MNRHPHRGSRWLLRNPLALCILFGAALLCGAGRGSFVTDLLTNSSYQVTGGNLTVGVQGHYGAILEQ